MHNWQVDVPIRKSAGHWYDQAEFVVGILVPDEMGQETVAMLANILTGCHTNT